MKKVKRSLASVTKKILKKKLLKTTNKAWGLKQIQKRAIALLISTSKIFNKKTASKSGFFLSFHRLNAFFQTVVKFSKMFLEFRWQTEPPTNTFISVMANYILHVTDTLSPLASVVFSNSRQEK